MMTHWPQRPTIYEINTWVWLHELSEQARRPITLGEVPTTVWDGLASYGFDAVWLMGVWERSPAGIAVSMRNDALVTEFRRLLPDFTAQDNVGSAYCVKDYRVDARLGGPKGLGAGQIGVGRTGDTVDPGFRAQPCGAGSLVGNGTSGILHSRQRTRVDRTARRVPPDRRSCAGLWAGSLLPALAGRFTVERLSVTELRKATIATVLSIADQCDGDALRHGDAAAQRMCLNAHGGNAPVPCRRPSIGVR